MKLRRPAAMFYDVFYIFTDGWRHAKSNKLKNQLYIILAQSLHVVFESLMRHPMMLRQQIKRTVQLLLIGLTGTTFAGAASAAINYEFVGSASGGTGKAIMSFDDTLNNKLRVDIDNISPTVLDNGSGVNSPGISAMAFDLDLVPEQVGFKWRLEALSSADGSLVTIGNNYGVDCYGGSCLWSDSGSGGGSGPLGNQNFQLEYLYGTSNGQGLLYNPAVDQGFGGAPHYFTTAVLTLEFASGTTSAVPTSTALRMMNVGRKGEGSITMSGEPCTEGDDCYGGGGGNGGDVPEPTGLALVALGIAGLGATRRRNKRRQAATADA